MTEQQTLDAAGVEPKDACFYYEACGNTVPAGSGLSCNTCLGLARHKDKLGSEKSGDLMEFLGQLYDQYEDPDEVMAALYERGPTAVVNDVTR